jgi:hypothetical protein
VTVCQHSMSLSRAFPLGCGRQTAYSRSAHAALLALMLFTQTSTQVELELRSSVLASEVKRRHDVHVAELESIIS